MQVTVSGNRTGSGGRGGPGDQGGSGGNGGNGADIHNAAGHALTLLDSTVSANQTGTGGPFGDLWLAEGFTGGDGGSGGGICNAGFAAVGNSTLSGNVTGDGGRGYYYEPEPGDDPSAHGYAGNAGDGAAVWSSGTTTLTYATVTQNLVGNDGWGVDGPATEDGTGGGLYLAGGDAATVSTIIAGNDMPTADTYDDCYGSLTSAGYNLVGSGTGCAAGAAGDQTTSTPGLAPLAENGGETATHALLIGSPAIEQIPDGAGGCATGLTTDQRGMVRADGANRGGTHCDVGAFEYASSETPTVVTALALAAKGIGLWHTIPALGMGAGGLVALAHRRHRRS
jgi:hypothetical protein